MAYADSFAECMQGSGVSVDASVVSDESVFADAVAYIKSWLDSIDATARSALDDASQVAEPVAAYLVDANIAPGVPELMNAFDSSSGMALSTFIDWCIYCAEQAGQAGQSEES